MVLCACLFNISKPKQNTVPKKKREGEKKKREGFTKLLKIMVFKG